MSDKWIPVKIGDLLTPISKPVKLDDNTEYLTIKVKRNHGGVIERERLLGSLIKTKKQFQLIPGTFIISRVQCWHEAYDIVPEFEQNAVISTNYDQFLIDSSIDKHFFLWLSFSNQFVNSVRDSAKGVDIEKMVFNKESWLEKTLHIPSNAIEQKKIAEYLENVYSEIKSLEISKFELSKKISNLQQAINDEIPRLLEKNNWKSFTLDEISDIQSGVTLGRTLKGNTIELPYLRVANVQDEFLNLDEIKYVTIMKNEFEKWQLEKGDLLLTEGGDWDKLGRGTVWQGQIKNCIHQNHIFRVRVDLNEYDPFFLSSLISSSYGKHYFQKASKSTTNLASINKTQLKNFKIFKPPIKVQNKIIQNMRLMKKEISKALSILTQIDSRSKELLPAILNNSLNNKIK